MRAIVSVLVFLGLLGVAPFWCSCDANCDYSSWIMWGQVVVSIIAIGVAIFASYWARRQWLYDKEMKRKELFYSLSNFYDFQHVEDVKTKMLSNVGKTEEIKSILMRMAHVVSILDQEMIDEECCESFKDSINAFLANDKVIEILSECSNGDSSSLLYRPLEKYIDENDIKPCQEGEKDDEQYCEKEKSITKEELQAYPCIMIRVNKQYRDGMSSDDIYAIGRGYWKVDLKRAEKAKYAIVCANGFVKEIFKINRWDSMAGNEIASRKIFDGSVAHSEVRDKFINRSIRGLFKKGAQNPISYFGIH